MFILLPCDLAIWNPFTNNLMSKGKGNNKISLAFKETQIFFKTFLLSSNYV